MMKPRTQFLIIIGLIILVLGIAWSTYPGRKQEPANIFPAKVQRDCAPWDGPAFTVVIPMDDGWIVSISIWKTPDIKSPVTFSFPENTGQVGNASLMHSTGLPEPLSGTVSFVRVEQDIPVEGTFDFVTETGEKLNGMFWAEWGEEMILCG